MSFKASASNSQDCEINSDSDSPSRRSRSRSPIRRNLNQIDLNIQQEINMPDVPQLKKEYLDMLPDFIGQAQLLPRFIEIAEKLVNTFYNAANPEDFQNDYLMSTVISKIKGEAACNISSCTITC